MTARSLVLPVSLAAFLVAVGCSTPVVPTHDGKVAAPDKSNLPVAPAPRAAEDGIPPPAPEVFDLARSDKPWSELIIGKWWHVNREGRLGDSVREFTRDGKVIERYSYPARLPSHPEGVEVSEWEYRVDGNLLAYPSLALPHDDGFQVTRITTIIETLTEGELVTLSIQHYRPSLFFAKDEADRRKVPLEQVLTEVREKRGRTYYVRFKDTEK